MRIGLRVGLLGLAVAVALIVPSVASAATPGKIAFVSNRDGHNEIYVMNADGTAQTRLSFTGNTVSNQDPFWSPDGKQIGFISNRGGTGNQIWIMNADGSGAHQITTIDGGTFSADWSPDGTQVLFGASPPGTENNAYVVNVDGSGLRQVTTFTTPTSYGYHFAPDGTKIVFTHESTGPPPDRLELASLTGAFLGNPTSVDSYAPDFTGDGNRIVFYSDGGTGEDYEIYSVMPDGSGLLQLTNTPSVAGTTDDERAPSPSRDGLNRIAFVSFRGGDQELYVMNGDGSGVTPLTDTTGTNRGPDWQPTAVCHGKVATIVGTGGSETLTGGPAADIISGQGGKDTVNGGGGNDTICGDAGKDKLNGQGGKDLLDGGKGNDKLNGGRKKDTCIGGKGKKDTAKKCEKEKKIP